MEITLSKKTISNIISILLLAVVLFGGYFAWKQGLFQEWLPASGTAQTSPADEPALASLAAMYSPNGERAEWEKHVCKGTTEKGCEMFRSMFANQIWNSLANKQIATIVYIETVDILEGGSQVWKTEVSDGDKTQPIYIHVAQNEVGQWLLNRVLFTQETAKYQDQ